MKPPILSDKEIKEIGSPYIAPTNAEWAIKPDHEYWRIHRLLKAQLDADVAYYEPLIQQVAREIFEEIEKLPLGISQHTFGLDHYDKEGNEIMTHQPDCLLCKFLKVKSKYGGQK